MLDYALTEYNQILKEQRNELGEGFACGSIDFYTDYFHRESFGAFVVDLLVEKYQLVVGGKTVLLAMTPRSG